MALSRSAADLSEGHGSGAEEEGGCAEAAATPVEDQDFARHFGVSVRGGNGFRIGVGYGCGVVGLLGLVGLLLCFFLGCALKI